MTASPLNIIYCCFWFPCCHDWFIWHHIIILYATISIQSHFLMLCCCDRRAVPLWLWLPATIYYLWLFLVCHSTMTDICHNLPFAVIYVRRKIKRKKQMKSASLCRPLRILKPLSLNIIYYCCFWLPCCHDWFMCHYIYVILYATICIQSHF